jgi:hypothetical protein
VPTLMVNPENVEPAYVAGIIDGEGYIGIKRHNRSYAVIVKVGMSDKGERCVLALHATYGGRTGYYQPRQSAQQRPCVEWAISGRAAVDVIEDIRPYLLIKGEAADLAMELQAMIDAAPRLNNHAQVASWDVDMEIRGADLMRRIQDINQRGVTPGELECCA